MTQTITLKVSIDCDACKKKVKKALDGIPGVETIDVDMKNERVTVVGTVEPKVLIKKLAKVGKKAEMGGGGHGKGGAGGGGGEMGCENSNGYMRGSKGKNGYRSGGGKTTETESEDEDDMPHPETIANMFSDENANSCSIM